MEANGIEGDECRTWQSFALLRKISSGSTIAEDTLTETSTDESHTVGYIDLLWGLRDTCCKLDDSTLAKKLLEDFIRAGEGELGFRSLRESEKKP